MKIGKIIFSLVGVLVLLVGGVAWYVLSNLNTIVKNVVETEASKVLQTPVTLELVDIRLMEGSAKLGVFNVQNYEGFEQPYMFSFETIKVDIDPSTVNDPVIILDEVTISGVSIVAEQKGSITNLQTLNSKLPKSSESSGSSSENSESSTSTEEKLFAIKKLNFVNNAFGLATEKYGRHAMQLPDINRIRLGSASEGLTAEELAIEIVKPLLEQVKDKVEKGLVDLAKTELEEKYGDKVDEEKEKLKEKVEKELGGDVDKAKDKLKDLKKLF